MYGRRPTSWWREGGSVVVSSALTTLACVPGTPSWHILLLRKQLKRIQVFSQNPEIYSYSDWRQRSREEMCYVTLPRDPNFWIKTV